MTCSSNAADARYCFTQAVAPAQAATAAAAALLLLHRPASPAVCCPQMKLGARQTMKGTAEKRGVQWTQTVEELKKSGEGPACNFCAAGLYGRDLWMRPPS